MMIFVKHHCQCYRDSAKEKERKIERWSFLLRNNKEKLQQREQHNDHFVALLSFLCLIVRKAFIRNHIFESKAKLIVLNYKELPCWDHLLANSFLSNLSQSIGSWRWEESESFIRNLLSISFSFIAVRTTQRNMSQQKIRWLHLNMLADPLFICTVQRHQQDASSFRST